MAVKLFNTLSKTKEVFVPLVPREVKLYSCGPTVYNYAHIGNFRAFVFSDTVRRTFEYLGYEVMQVMNITDVDDKTIRGAKTAGIPLKEFTTKYENIWRSELAQLGVLPPHQTPRASGYIEEMIEMIKTLLEKGLAYPADDGVYFDIAKSEDYGQLADLKLDSHTQSRINNDEYDKNNPQDFALWKFWKEDDGEVEWDAPFGAGRPGWHIECSAMSTALLGEQLDIHTGGIDNIFPHHTNEIAQSEGVTGEHFVNYWLHVGHIHIADEKMSKSVGNIVYLETLENNNINPLAYRYWLLTSHYRTTTNFTLEAVTAAGEAYKKLHRLMIDLSEIESGQISEMYRIKFIEALEDDLNTPQAIAITWEMANDGSISPANKKATLLDFDRVLGLGLNKIKPEIIPTEVTVLLEKRDQARTNSNWTESDNLRDQIDALGFEVKDTPAGQKVYKK